MEKDYYYQKFIEKAYNVHGNKYDYSKIEYINSATKVCIVCPEHGEFWQTPAHHLQGCGCPKCSSKVVGKKNTMQLIEFINRANKIHNNKYDYSRANYINAHTKVCIICPEHGEFWQMPYEHLNGKGCKKCGIIERTYKLKKTKEYFIKESSEKHNNKYDYSRTNYINAYTKVCIICPEHGEFWQRPNDHLNGKGCPICRESKMEKEIHQLLEDNNIFFIHNASKKDIEWIGEQHLDFYLPDYNVAIECQGIQHFKPVTFGSKNKDGKEMLDYIKKNDETKRHKCYDNGIKLLYYSSEVCARNVLNNKDRLINTILNG